MSQAFSRRLCFGLGLTFAALGNYASATPAPIVFGVLNQQSPARTAERWNPLLQYVSAKTGLDLQLRMGATVRETNAMMGRGEFDFVVVNDDLDRAAEDLERIFRG